MGRLRGKDWTRAAAADDVSRIVHGLLRLRPSLGAPLDDSYMAEDAWTGDEVSDPPLPAPSPPQEASYAGGTVQRETVHRIETTVTRTLVQWPKGQARQVGKLTAKAMVLAAE